MKKELENNVLTPTEKAPNSFGKAMGHLGVHAKETVAKAQSAVMHAVDKNGNGKSEKNNKKRATD